MLIRRGTFAAIAQFVDPYGGGLSAQYTE